MSKNLPWQLGTPVPALLVPNSPFALHVSIIGSRLLAVARSFAFGAFRGGR